MLGDVDDHFRVQPRRFSSSFANRGGTGGVIKGQIDLAPVSALANRRVVAVGNDEGTVRLLEALRDRCVQCGPFESLPFFARSALVADTYT